MKLTKQEKSWVCYDWANSVYATIMIAAVFPIYFTGICGEAGDFWWGIGTTLSMALLAVCAPIIGALADYKGFKKKLFAGLLALGLIFTLVAGLTDAWQMMLIGYIISHIGFSGSNLVYDSFLTDITTKDRMDKISSLGFALGYIGGSTIPFVFSIVLINFGADFGIDATLAVKISLGITVVWWGLFSIPMLLNVKQGYGLDVPKKGILKGTFSSIVKTAKDIIKNKPMLIFMLSYFFYIDGVGTVMSMATSYGTTLGLGTVGMILALLVTQLVAVPCAIIFGWLSGKFGPITMLLWAIIVYFGICVLGFVMGFGLEEDILTLGQAEMIFWFLAVMVGTVQGGIQAISRSFFGKLVPPERSGEYFGFFDIFGKFAAVVGPALYALVKGVTGRSSLSILSIILLFAVAFAILSSGKKYFKEI